MNFDEFKKQKEIIAFIKDIKDLTEQQKNPTRDGMEKIILNIRNKYLAEIGTFEMVNTIKINGIMTNIKNISDKDLYDRLKIYKDIVEEKFLEKYGNDIFNKLVIEYELEV